MNRVISLLNAHANLLMLFLSLVLGQGVTVAVYLSLAYFGQAELVGALSLGVQIASLGLFVTDFGGAFYLSRLTAARVRGGRAHMPHRQFAILTGCRIATALPAIAVLIWTGVSGIFSPVTSAFLIAAAPALAIQAFNISGALDGAGRAGVAGLSNTLYFLFPTLGLAVAAAYGQSRGLWLGALFTLGVTGAVLIQHAYARMSGVLRYSYLRALERGRSARWRTDSRSISGLFLYSVSGQVISRGQIIIAGLFFPLEIVGALALAKQIANGASQVVGLFRRVELPRLVQRARADRALSALDGVRIQKWGTLAGLAFAVVFVLFAFIPARWTGGAAPALTLLAMHAPAIVTAALFAAANQTFIARNQTHVASSANWFVVIVSLLGVWGVSAAQWAPGVFLVEAGVQLVTLAGLLLYAQDRRTQ